MLLIYPGSLPGQAIVRRKSGTTYQAAYWQNAWSGPAGKRTFWLG
jgi:hypothetical protein